MFSYKTRPFYRSKNDSLDQVKLLIFDWISTQGQIEIVKIQYLNDPERYEITYRGDFAAPSTGQFRNYR